MNEEDVDMNQSTIAERLFLLDELQYCDLNMQYHSNKSTHDEETNRDIQLLNTIAVVLCTGKPGDVVAAAFDKRSRLQLRSCQERTPNRR